MISTPNVRSSLYRRFLGRIFPERPMAGVTAPVLEHAEDAETRDRRVPDRRRRVGTLPGGRRAADKLRDGLINRSPIDRRKEPRFIPRHRRVYVSWWKGDAFHTEHATLENVSRYGAAMLVDDIPPDVNLVWACFVDAPRRDWHAADVVGVGRRADGTQLVRIALRHPLPFCIFSTIVWGARRPATARDESTTKFVSPATSAPCRDGSSPARKSEASPRQIAHYQILESLGAGGMGQVYVAEDSELERRVALKVMHPHLARDPSARVRFLREARAAAALQHDNIVTIFQVGQHDEVPFIAMQLLEGESLASWVGRVGRAPLGDVIRIGGEIAAGLTAAHRAGLIHRDIKPENIWLEAPRQRVKLLDFGLATTVAQESNLTQSGYLLGTPAYMSPEQALSEPCDHRSDLFSLGIILYRLCGGELPFAGKSAFATLTAVTKDSPRPLDELNPALPAPLVTLIEQLLAKKPDDRPADAAAVQASLLALGEALRLAAQVLAEDAGVLA